MGRTRKPRQSRFTLVDLLILLLALLLFGGALGFGPWPDWVSLVQCGLLLMACLSAFMFVFNVNRSLWRYAEDTEYLRMFLAYGCGAALFALIEQLVFNHVGSLVFVVAVTCGSLLCSFLLRLLYRYWLRRRHSGDEQPIAKRYLAIIGAGDAGVSLLDEIQRNQNSKNPYVVWCLFDDDPLKIGQTIRGVPVYGPINDLPHILKDSPVKDLALAIPSLDLGRRRNIISLCGSVQCKLRIMPDAIAIMEQGEGRFSASLRNVRVEDLLSRTTISFSRHELDELAKDKTILVTGGGGSIGSELCRQIARAGVGQLVIFDICENDAYMLYQELRHSLGERLNIRVEIGSVADPRRVASLFERYRPDVVFHAAAHKHVPLMEECVYEAVRNNIFGTYYLLRAAHDYGVKKFVQISTDKAVNPTNVMGATKRYCELMVRAMAARPDCATDFVAVRFGNVLGSSGSVLPLFQMQIARGGPVTVTDRRVTRYFMTIAEAAGLTIKAAAMARRSEIYVLDMGKPVRILELAENIIRLSGYEPYREIPIVETGLRPGEKLYEELLIDDREHASTAVSKIYVERNVERAEPARIEEELRQLGAAMDSGDEGRVLAVLRRLVPTFKTPDEVNNALPDTEPGYPHEYEPLHQYPAAAAAYALAHQGRGA